MVVTLTPTMRHPASLVPVSEHDPALLDLLAATPSSRLLSYIAERAAEVVPVRTIPSSGLYTPPATPIKATHAAGSPPQAVNSPALVSLETFIRGVAIKSQVRTPTLLVTLILLNRLKVRLPEIAKGAHDSLHRIWLAALIVAAKSVHDCSPLNRHWARYASNAFCTAEINMMEIQFLSLLDHQLIIRPNELWEVAAPLLPPTERLPKLPSELQATPVARAPTLDSCPSATSDSSGSDSDDAPPKTPTTAGLSQLIRSLTLATLDKRKPASLEKAICRSTSESVIARRRRAVID